MKNIIHTAEQLKKLNKTSELFMKLRRLDQRYDNNNLTILVDSLENELRTELSKYDCLVNTPVLYKSALSLSSTAGTITAISHFACNSVSVRVDYYDGGFDIALLTELKDCSVVE